MRFHRQSPEGRGAASLPTDQGSQLRPAVLVTTGAHQQVQPLHFTDEETEARGRGSSAGVGGGISFPVQSLCLVLRLCCPRFSCSLIFPGWDLLSGRVCGGRGPLRRGPQVQGRGHSPSLSHHMGVRHGVLVGNVREGVCAPPTPFTATSVSVLPPGGAPTFPTELVPHRRTSGSAPVLWGRPFPHLPRC